MSFPFVELTACLSWYWCARLCPWGSFPFACIDLSLEQWLQCQSWLWSRWGGCLPPPLPSWVLGFLVLYQPYQSHWYYPVDEGADQLALPDSVPYIKLSKGHWVPPLASYTSALRTRNSSDPWPLSFALQQVLGLWLPLPLLLPLGFLSLNVVFPHIWGFGLIFHVTGFGWSNLFISRLEHAALYHHVIWWQRIPPVHSVNHINSVSNMCHLWLLIL